MPHCEPLTRRFATAHSAIAGNPHSTDSILSRERLLESPRHDEQNGSFEQRANLLKCSCLGSIFPRFSGRCIAVVLW